MRIHCSHDRQSIPNIKMETIKIFLVQLECIPLAIEGKDVMCERDSSGKTSSFVISTLHNLEPIDGIVSILVVVPNREMASTIVAEYHRFSKYLKPVKVSIITILYYFFKMRYISYESITDWRIRHTHQTK